MAAKEEPCAKQRASRYSLCKIQKNGFPFGCSTGTVCRRCLPMLLAVAQARAHEGDADVWRWFYDLVPVSLLSAL